MLVKLRIEKFSENVWEKRMTSLDSGVGWRVITENGRVGFGDVG